MVITLVLSALLLGLAAWNRAQYRQRQQLSLPVLQQIIREQPRAFVPGSVLLTGWVYGELEGGVLPLTASGELGEPDPSRPRMKFVVPTWWRERLEIERSMERAGIPFLEGSLGLRFYYRAYFTAGLLALLVALGLFADERWTRGMAESDRARDREWLAGLFKWGAASVGCVACGVAAGFYFAPVTQWNMLIALPAIWGPIGLGGAGLAACLFGALIRLGQRWTRSPERAAAKA